MILYYTPSVLIIVLAFLWPNPFAIALLALAQGGLLYYITHRSNDDDNDIEQISKILFQVHKGELSERIVKYNQNGRYAKVIEALNEALDEFEITLKESFRIFYRAQRGHKVRMGIAKHLQGKFAFSIQRFESIANTFVENLKH
jgi:hypothetical protein